jgi:hypothetical protein
MIGPYEIEDPVEIPGLEQIPGNTIEDAVACARWELEHSYPSVAMRWAPALRIMIGQKTWRSEAAADVLLRIERAFTAQLASIDLSTPEDIGIGVSTSSSSAISG